MPLPQARAFRLDGQSRMNRIVHSSKKPRVETERDLRHLKRSIQIRIGSEALSHAAPMAQTDNSGKTLVDLVEIF